jgi:hypothetical protein
VSSKANEKVPEKIVKAVIAKTIYVGKDGISFKQAVQLANLGYRILFK